MQRISYPLIKGCAVSYGTLDVFDTYPKTLPNLYAGTQLTVLGRFKNAITAEIAFAGAQGAQEIVLRQSLPFGATAAKHAFVPRMWASAKIDHLLDQIAMYGENAELVNNVKQLGKKYSIITPYTSMLVVEPTGPSTSAKHPLEDKTMGAASSFRLWRDAAYSTAQSMMLCYSVPKRSAARRVLLRIFDARGRLVRTLVDDITMGGVFRITWDGADMSGRALGTGWYMAVLESGTDRQILRVRLMK
jgi:hypothetical protein